MLGLQHLLGAVVWTHGLAAGTAEPGDGPQTSCCVGQRWSHGLHHNALRADWNRRCFARGMPRLKCSLAERLLASQDVCVTHKPKSLMNILVDSPELIASRQLLSGSCCTDWDTAWLQRKVLGACAQRKRQHGSCNAACQLGFCCGSAKPVCRHSHMGPVCAVPLR